MQTTLFIDVLTELTRADRSVDELILTVQQVMTQTSLPDLVAQLLEAQDAALIRQWRAGQLAPPACCAQPVYEVRDWQRRQLRTRLGVVRFRWRRLTCRSCLHGWVPLRDAVGLALRQPCSAELTQLVVEQSSQQSYRQVEAELAATTGIRVPKSTAQRWVRRQQAAATLPVEGVRYPAVLADGTNYPSRPRPGPGGSTRGDVRVVVGLTRTGHLEPVGEWSGDSWAAIGQQVAATGLRAVCLVSDGEPGLMAGLASLVGAFQRCHWHLAKDLDPALTDDQVAKAVRRQWQQRLRTVLAVELPPNRPAADTPAARQALTQAWHRAEWHLATLIREAEQQGWTHAAGYLRRAQPETFTYVALWLSEGLRIPRTTSVLERRMETLARRLKRIARNWSEAGAAQMAGLVLQQYDHVNGWLAYWRHRLRLSGTVRVSATVRVT